MSRARVAEIGDIGIGDLGGDGSAHAEQDGKKQRRAPGIASAWTEAQTVEVGPVEPVSVVSVTRGASLSLLLRTFYYGVVHALTTP